MWSIDDVNNLISIKLLKESEEFTKDNNKLQKEIDVLQKEIDELREEIKYIRKLNKELKMLNKELAKELSFFKTENSTLTKGLAECCDRLWYYFGCIGNKWSDNRCKDVYEVAQFYLERAMKGEDDAGKY